VCGLDVGFRLLGALDRLMVGFLVIRLMHFIPSHRHPFSRANVVLHNALHLENAEHRATLWHPAHLSSLEEGQIRLLKNFTLQPPLSLIARHCLRVVLWFGIHLLLTRPSKISKRIARIFLFFLFSSLGLSCNYNYSFVRFLNCSQATEKFAQRCCVYMNTSTMVAKQLSSK
jgi:hypothetical protein